MLNAPEHKEELQCYFKPEMQEELLEHILLVFWSKRREMLDSLYQARIWAGDDTDNTHCDEWLDLTLAGIIAACAETLPAEDCPQELADELYSFCVDLGTCPVLFDPFCDRIHDGEIDSGIYKGYREGGHLLEERVTRGEEREYDLGGNVVGGGIKYGIDKRGLWEDGLEDKKAAGSGHVAASTEATNMLDLNTLWSAGSIGLKSKESEGTAPHSEERGDEIDREKHLQEETVEEDSIATGVKIAMPHEETTLKTDGFSFGHCEVSQEEDFSLELTLGQKSVQLKCNDDGLTRHGMALKPIEEAESKAVEEKEEEEEEMPEIEEVMVESQGVTVDAKVHEDKRPKENRSHAPVDVTPHTTAAHTGTTTNGIYSQQSVEVKRPSEEKMETEAAASTTAGAMSGDPASILKEASKFKEASTLKESRKDSCSPPEVEAEGADSRSREAGESISTPHVAGEGGSGSNQVEDESSESIESRIDRMKHIHSIEICALKQGQVYKRCDNFDSELRAMRSRQEVELRQVEEGIIQVENARTRAVVLSTTVESPDDLFKDRKAGKSTDNESVREPLKNKVHPGAGASKVSSSNKPSPGSTGRSGENTVPTPPWEREDSSPRTTRIPHSCKRGHSAFGYRARSRMGHHHHHHHHHSHGANEEEDLRRAEAERQKRISNMMRHKEQMRANRSGVDKSRFAPATSARPVSRTPDLETEEREAYIARLLQLKPWLTKLMLSKLRLPVLRSRFVLSESEVLEKSEASYLELQHIKEQVAPRLHEPVESKSDEDLLMDVRFFGKHAHFLTQRFASRNFYQILGLGHPGVHTCSSVEIKKAFRKMALVWHPDSIRKSWRFFFANEKALQVVVTEIYRMIDDAYRVLSDEEGRRAYDGRLQQQRYYT